MKLKQFEVRIEYEGSSGYIVIASTKQSAERQAKILYDNGDVSHTAASDVERITKVYSNALGD